MQNYDHFDPFENERRDILREIDAGDLDECYLIKHANDYGKHAATHPLNVLQAAFTILLNLTNRSYRPKQIDKAVTPFSHPITR